MDWEHLDEMPYRKVKKKKRSKKADHKHDYRPILIHAPNFTLWHGRESGKYNYYLARRCTVCGKVIGTWSSFSREPNGMYVRFGFPVRDPIDFELTHDVYESDAIGPHFTEEDTVTLVRKSKI